MSTVCVFRSTDYGAPTSVNTAGSMITLLDACLINGYGAQTVTITRSGSTATITFPVAHGFALGNPCIKPQILISGANEVEYNGQFEATPVTATTVSIQVTGTPATPATGTITAKVAPAKWSKLFSGSNKVVYKQGSGSNLFCLYLDDSVAGSCKFKGCESATDVNTLISLFPTESQISGGMYWWKSDSSTARFWTLIASEKFLIWLADYNTSALSNSYWMPCLFGDIIPTDPTDPYATISVGTQYSSSPGPDWTSITSFSGTTQYTYIARRYGGIGSSRNVSRVSPNSGLITSLGYGGYAFPNPIDGKLHYSPVYIGDPLGIRGKIPGIWNPLHSRPLVHGDLFQGSGVDASRTFLVWNIYSSGQIFIEVSNTWYS